MFRVAAGGRIEMNKLREQIAQKLPKPNCVGCEYECGKLTGCLALEKTADAIIALLQPRMLSKDEVELIHQMLRLENVQMNLGDWASFDTLFDKVAKLKLIQEEDSE